jgi:REP element-mobilizing transposase RayT
MRNHFHLLVRIKTIEEYRSALIPKTRQSSEFKPSQHFSNLFNAYTKAINKTYQRTGSLFEERFGRIEVTSNAYFANLIFYIHFNPQKHGFVNDFRDWPWSSYATLNASTATKLNRVEVLNWFGSAARYEEFHRGMMDEKAVATLIDEDLV